MGELLAAVAGDVGGRFVVPLLSKKRSTPERVRDEFARTLSQFDLLLTVTIQHLPFEIARWDAAWTTESSKYPGGSFVPTWTGHTFMFNWLGWPALSVPAGFVQGLPVGLQIIGRPNDEARMLRRRGGVVQRVSPPRAAPDQLMDGHGR